MRSAFRLIAIFAAFFVTETILLAHPSLAGCTIYQDRGYSGQSLQFKRNSVPGICRAVMGQQSLFGEGNAGLPADHL